MGITRQGHRDRPCPLPSTPPSQCPCQYNSIPIHFSLVNPSFLNQVSILDTDTGETGCLPPLPVLPHRPFPNPSFSSPLTLLHLHLHQGPNCTIALPSSGPSHGVYIPPRCHMIYPCSCSQSTLITSPSASYYNHSFIVDLHSKSVTNSSSSK